MRQNLQHVHNGVVYEGFRPYRGDEDVVNRTRNARYGMITAICTARSPQKVEDKFPQNSCHTVWTVIDTKATTYLFEEFLTQFYPEITHIRYLRSRT